MLNGQRHFKHLWSTGIPLIKSQAKEKIKEKEEITHFNWETQYPLGPPPQFLWLPAASTVNKPITAFSGQSPQFVCFSLCLRRLKSCPPNEFIINILYKKAIGGSYSITTKVSKWSFPLIKSRIIPPGEVHIQLMDCFSREKGSNAIKQSRHISEGQHSLQSVVWCPVGPLWVEDV